MRIVLVGPTSPLFKGGIVHYTYSLYRELAKKNTVKLISFNRGYPKQFFPGAANSDKSKEQYKITNEKALLDWINPLSYWATYQEIKRFKPEIVVWQWWTWFWTLPSLVVLGCSKLSGTKIVIIAHNPFDHEVALYKNWLSHSVLSLANRIMVPNLEVKEELSRAWPKKDIVLAIHPVYSLFGEPRESTYRKTTKSLLFFGHIRNYKGLDLLLLALNKLWSKGVKVKLTIAGEFWESKEKYLQLVDKKHLPNLEIIDHYLKNEEVGVLFNEADAVVIPYRSGSGSGPSKLAISFLKPIIATPVGDTPDLFRLGRVGIMLKSVSADELEKAIAQFIEQKGSRYDKDLIKLRKELSWEKLVNKIVT